MLMLTQQKLINIKFIQNKVLARDFVNADSKIKCWSLFSSLFFTSTFYLIKKNPNELVWSDWFFNRIRMGNGIRLCATILHTTSFNQVISKGLIEQRKRLVSFLIFQLSPLDKILFKNEG